MHLPPGLDQHVQAHPCVQTPDGDGDETRRCKAEVRSRGGLVAWVEALEIDPRRHDDHPGRLDAVALHHQAAEPLGQHDDHLGPPVDRPLDFSLHAQDAAVLTATDRALVRPRTLEVHDQRESAQPRREDRQQGIEREVGVNQIDIAWST